MLGTGGTTPTDFQCPVCSLAADVWANHSMFQTNLAIKRCLNNVDFTWHGLEAFVNFPFTAEVWRRLYKSIALQAPWTNVSPAHHKKPRPCEKWTSFIWMEISCSIEKEQVSYLFTGTYLQVLLLLTNQCVFFSVYPVTTILGGSKITMSSSYVVLLLHYIYLGEGTILLNFLHVILTMFF